MGACDQLFQHLALGQAVMVRQSFERKMGDEVSQYVSLAYTQRLQEAELLP